jgi:hypothetical protein
MAETNPLFAPRAMPDVEPLFSVHRLPQRPAGVAADRAYGRLAQRAKLVADLLSTGTIISAMSVVPAENDQFLIDMTIDPAYAISKNVVKAVLIPEAQRVEYVTLDDLDPARASNYEARKLSASQATAFSNIEAVRDAPPPNLLPHLTRYLRSIFQAPYGRALADRIEKLAEMVLEESDGAQPLSGESLAGLIAFLERNPALTRPSMVAGPSGELIAIWKQAGRGEFSARFLPTGAVRFLVSRPNQRHPQGVSRLSGDTTADKLFAEAGLDELRWLFNG